jgi:hypothetical protein
MSAFDPDRRCRLHEQFNDRIDDWTPITVDEWRQRMKWHDPAEGHGLGRPTLRRVGADR